MKSSLLLLLLVGCSTVPVGTVRTKSLSSTTPAPHYHTISWSAAKWSDNATDPVEYDIFSTTNIVDWTFEARTTNLFVYITNDFPKQYYKIGAHSK